MNRDLFVLAVCLGIAGFFTGFGMRHCTERDSIKKTRLAERAEIGRAPEDMRTIGDLTYFIENNAVYPNDLRVTGNLIVGGKLMVSGKTRTCTNE